jgi:hypothetical protein
MVGKPLEQCRLRDLQILQSLQPLVCRERDHRRNFGRLCGLLSIARRLLCDLCSARCNA